MAEQELTPLVVDEKTLLAETEEKFSRWREARKAHEGEWFLAAAFLRGQQNVEYDQYLHQLTVPDAPSHAVRLTINKIRPKVKARLSKFTKNRPIPIVVPATTDREDILNARATQKILLYLWDKLGLEKRAKWALLWASMCGKGFWWISWDDTTLGRVRVEDPMLGGYRIEEAMLGDVVVEVGSPFEVLVADPGIADIGSQPEIMRIKMRDLADVKQRYAARAEQITGEDEHEETFHYEKRIASLTGRTATLAGGDLFGRHDLSSGRERVLVKELFTKPCAKYPKGRYLVVAGHTLVRVEQELPYDFTTYTDNPYPVVEFADSAAVGQFWSTTVIAQLIDPQREYNLIRRKNCQQIKLQAHPKLVVFKQHQLPHGAYTSEAGEVLEVMGLPGVPPPFQLPPGNISSDVWRELELLTKEFDDLTHIYPATEGKVGTASSGFQTNLLQEAADSVHAPDIRDYELSVQEAAWKIRKLYKLGASVPRLVTIVGRNSQPEVVEFSSDTIDDYSDIRVQAGSALPTLKAAKLQSVLELWSSGILGDGQDPEVRRRVLGMIELGGLENLYEEDRRDEDRARWIINEVREGRPVPPADPWENHLTQTSIYADQLKSHDMNDWTPEQRMALVVRWISHAEYINPQQAGMLYAEFGLAPSERLMRRMSAMQPPAPPAAEPQPGQGPAGPPTRAQPMMGAQEG